LVVYNETVPDINRIIMNDPYNMGRTLSIPAVLISKENGEKLKKFYYDNKDNEKVLDSIRLEIDFEVGKKDDIVEYEVFYTGNSKEVYKLLSDLSEINESLGAMVRYKSRYVSTASFEFNRGTFIDNDYCMVKGKYCPLFYNPFAFTPAEFISAHIKERCLQDYIKKNKLNSSYFWSFISKIEQSCFVERKYTNLTECVDSELTALLGSNALTEIVECFMNSFDPHLHDGKQLT
jgi:hypothetical protein